MNCWVAIYTHRHGVDAWPLFRDSRPTEAQVIKGLNHWEPDKGEEIDIRGPFLVPTNRQELGDAYSKGWDSHEGSLLGILGIRDLECRGIDAIMKDLVRHCPGFREWRKTFKQGSMELKQQRKR